LLVLTVHAHPPPHAAAFETPSHTTDEEEAYKPRPTKNPRKAHGDGKAPVLSTGLKSKKRAAEAAAAGGGGGEEEEDFSQHTGVSEQMAALGGASSSSSSSSAALFKDLPKDQLVTLPRAAVAELKQNAGEALAELETKAESQEEGMVVPHDSFAKVLGVLADIKAFPL
jgi:hypothetical protein